MLEVRAGSYGVLVLFPPPTLFCTLDSRLLPFPRTTHTRRCSLEIRVPALKSALLLQPLPPTAGTATIRQPSCLSHLLSPGLRPTRLEMAVPGRGKSWQRRISTWMGRVS